MSGCGFIGLAFIYGEMLVDALKELQAARELKELLVAKEGATVPMTTRDGKTHRVSILVSTSAGVTVGFQRQKDGTLALISDGAEERERQRVVNRIAQRYAYLTVVSRLTQQGYSVVEKKEENDRSIRLVLRRWT